MVKLELNKSLFVVVMEHYDEGAFSYEALSAMYDWLEALQEEFDYYTEEFSTIDMLQQVKTLHIVMSEADDEELSELEGYNTAEKIADLENGKTLYIDWADLQ